MGTNQSLYFRVHQKLQHQIYEIRVSGAIFSLILNRRLRFIPEKLPFRDRWFYNNFAYMYVGCIIEKLAGQSWEEVIKTRLLEPIGMTSTHVEMDNIFQLPNIALPYYHGNNTILNGNKEIYKYVNCIISMCSLSYYFLITCILINPSFPFKSDLGGR